MEEQKETPTPQVTESPITQAEELVKRMEEANKHAEEILKKQQEIYSRNLLAGRSVVGDKPAPVDPEKAETERINQWLKPFGRQI